MSQLYEGYLSNVAFGDLVLTWQPDKIIGLHPTRDTQQEVCRFWKCSDLVLTSLSVIVEDHRSWTH